MLRLGKKLSAIYRIITSPCLTESSAIIPNEELSGLKTSSFKMRKKVLGWAIQRVQAVNFTSSEC